MRILWDFDGTLIDSYPFYTNILYKIVDGSYSKAMIYKHLKISQSHAIQHFNLSEKQTNIMKAKSKDIVGVKAFPQVEDVLKEAEVNVIMTHMNRASVERLLEEVNLSQYLAEIVAGDDGFPRKPNSASYAYLHEKYHLTHAVGDRELDLIPAKEIGLETVMFQNNGDFADYSINHYKEFFYHLRKK